MNERETRVKDRQRKLAALSPEQRAKFEQRVRGQAAAAPERVVPAREPGAAAPLSFGQERLWFLDQLQPGLPSYNEYFALRLTGSVSVLALEAALHGIVRRHEALRTVVAATDGVPAQRVLPAPEDVLRVVDRPDADAAELVRGAEEEAARPFDLAGGPLFRAVLTRGAAESLLVIVNHHFAGDGWSRTNLLRELSEGYRAFLDGGPEPAEPEVQYGDWSAWQRRELTDEKLAAPLRYWRENLAGLPPLLELPGDRPRPATASFQGGRVHFRLDAEATAAIDALGKSAKATPFMVALTAWLAVLGQYSGQRDVAVSTPVAGRSLPELAGSVGMFINSVVLRSGLDGDPTFAELLSRVKETVLGGLGHAEVPFERLVRELAPERDPGYAPLAQVQFGYRVEEAVELELPGVVAEPVELDNGWCRGDLALDLTRIDGETAGVCEYSRDLFDAETVTAFTESLVHVLRTAAANPELSLSELCTPTPADQAQLAEVNRTELSLTGVPDVVTAFAEQARRRPDETALVADGETLTFRELDERVRTLAARLRAAGVGPGTTAGICLHRGPDLVVALFGVLAAGAAYVPLDPAYPKARLAYVLEDARPAVVIAEPGQTVLPDGTAVLTVRGPAADFAYPTPDPASPAYVIHTSGSTGKPKGVVLSHRNLTHFLRAMDDTVEADCPITWLAVTSVSFDISVLEILWTLTRGHRVVFSPDRARPDAARPDFSLFYFGSTPSAPGHEQYRLLLEGAKFADGHEFAAVWLPERHFHEFGGPFPAPSVLAGAVAANTSRVAIRAGSVVLPLHHPIRVAEEWSVVDNLSAGRVGLSFASGWHLDDFVLAKDSYQDRGELTRSGLDVVRRLWRGERAEFEGPGGRQVEIGVLPRPVQPELPCWLTSSGNIETCRNAGRLGVGLLTHLLGQTVDELAERIAAYRAAWHEAGHPGQPHVTLMVHTYVGADAEDVRTTAIPHFRDYLRTSVGLIEKLAAGLGMDLSSADFTDDDREALLDHAVARYQRDASLIGTAEECGPTVARLTAAGVDEIACLLDFGVPVDAALAALPRLAALRETASPAEPPSLSQLVRDHGVTHLQCTPSLARTLLDEPDSAAFRALRLLLLGGEPLGADLADRLGREFGVPIRNMYGPTETTVWSTSALVPPGADPVGIGGPIANTTVHVLDRAGRPVPVGVAGELYLGGAGVADGYLGRPGQTAERFVADPFGPPGARLYRTGDVVRLRRTGGLEYLGRNDDQLKVRGFRVEPAEIEQALAALPGVRRAAVRAHEASLTGYVLLEPGAAETPEAELRAALAAELPAHLVPSRVLVLDEFPHTDNGKLDRAALPAPEGRPGGEPAVLPGTPTETELAAIWQSVLGIEQAGVTDDFFEQGGHSLLATQLVARVRRELAVELPLRSVFSAPTIAGLAAEIDRLRGTAVEPEAAALVPDPAHRHDPFPLTDTQRAYWIGRTGEMGGDVSCHLYVELDASDVDVSRLETSWRAMIERHDALRLVFGNDGTQRILPTVPEYAISVTDLRAASEVDTEAQLAELREHMSHQVLPSDTWPLFDLRVSRIGDTRVRLHLSIDTLIADGASVRILLRELLAHYRGELDASLPDLSFRDYVLAESALREGPAHERAAAYWRGRLETLPPAPQLPLRVAPAELASTRFRRREHRVPAEVWSRVKSFAAGRRITPSALALTAYAQTLGTWAASDRFTLNLTLFNRAGDHPDLATMVGDFTALSMFEVSDACGGSFEQRAKRVQEQLWDDLDHRLMSGVRVAGELARQRGGVADATMPVVFTSELGTQDVSGEALLEEFGATVAHTITQTPQVWLDHQISEEGPDLRLTWDAVEDLFPEGMLDTMFAAYVGLLHQLADPAAWTDERPELLPAAQTEIYREFNDTAGPIPAGLLHEPFLATAARTPDETAVISATGNRTYAELEAASRAVAEAVTAAGHGRGDLVGVLVERGWEQVAAVLGVLRAGAAYLPVDPRLPAARVAQVLGHAEAAALIALPDHDLTGCLPSGVQRISFDPAPSGAPYEPPAASADDVAYVIYTSGSTGQPKGVVIDHRGALNTVTDINERFGVGPADRVFGLSALGFDLSVYDIFGAFAAGAALVVPGADEIRDPASWTASVERNRVTVWNSVPALMEMLLAYAGDSPRKELASLRLVMLSGDWIPTGMPDAIRAVCPPAEVISLGGATEASIWSVYYPVGDVDPDWPSIPYGRPLRNQTMHVLDSQLRPRPPWVPGQLYIGGIGVALGYWHAPELTERAFITHPSTGERLYRTGDLARHLPDGTLEFLGREDTQVKVRGMRIELSEIESTLLKLPGVRESAVVVRGKGTSAELVSFVVAERPAPAPVSVAAASVPDPEAVAKLALRFSSPGRRTDLTGNVSYPAAGLDAAPTVASAKAFGQGPVALAAVTSLLSVLGQYREDGMPRYAYASAGGLYPVQAYLAVGENGVRGLPAGTYYYDPVDAALVSLKQGDWFTSALYDERNRPLAEQAGFAIFLVARNSAIEPQYGDLAERFCLLEAGAIAQLLRQRAADTGLALCSIGDVYDGPLQDGLLLEPGQTQLHSMLCGLPAGAPAESVEDTLRAGLAERLPSYMVPREVRVVDALPLSANGKVDRRRLVELAGAAAAPEKPAPALPSTSDTVVDRLSAIWRELLGVEDVGVDTNFFELGANSIHLVRAQRRIGTEFGREVPIVEMFDRPTIRQFAALLTGDGPARRPSVAPVAPAAEGRGGHHRRRRDARRESVRQGS